MSIISPFVKCVPEKTRVTWNQVTYTHTLKNSLGETRLAEIERHREGMPPSFKPALKFLTEFGASFDLGPMVEWTSEEEMWCGLTKFSLFHSCVPQL